MATPTLQDEQILDLMRQLPNERRSWLFQQLIQDEWLAWVDLSAYSLDRARRVAALRGLDWDRLTEGEREAFLDTLLHDDAPSDVISADQPVYRS